MKENSVYFIRYKSTREFMSRPSGKPVSFRSPKGAYASMGFISKFFKKSNGEELIVWRAEMRSLVFRWKTSLTELEKYISSMKKNIPIWI